MLQVLNKCGRIIVEINSCIRETALCYIQDCSAPLSCSNIHANVPCPCCDGLYHDFFKKIQKLILLACAQIIILHCILISLRSYQIVLFVEFIFQGNPLSQSCTLIRVEKVWVGPRRFFEFYVGCSIVQIRNQYCAIQSMAKCKK